jgi:glycosyltransferase involved in cell wall biosynthesis
MTAILINDLGDGGAQKSLSRLLAGLQKDRIRLVLIRNTIIQDLPDGVKPFILDESGKKSVLSLAFRLKRFIVAEDIQLVQSHLYRSNFINVFSRLLGSRHSIQLVNSGRAGRLLGEGFKGRLTLMLQKILYPHADLVICKSQGMAKDLKHYVKGIRNIQVIPNSFDVNSMGSGPEVSRHRSADSEALGIVSLGRLIPLKCHDLAIEAVHTLRNHKRSVGLTIYGDGRERPALESQVNALELANVVSLAGYAEDPFKVLAENDVLLSLSVPKVSPTSWWKP